MRSIVLLLLVARCLETIDVCIYLFLCLVTVCCVAAVVKDCV